MAVPKSLLIIIILAGFQKIILNQRSYAVVECKQLQPAENNDSARPRQVKLTLPKILLESSIQNVEHEYELDPALKIMSYDVGEGTQTVFVYVEPTLEQMYGNTIPPSLTKVEPKFRGFGGRFVNMSNRTLSFYWGDGESNSVLMKHCPPFTATSSGTFEGHLFYFAEENDPDRKLIEIRVSEYPNNVYYYDPYFVEGNPIETERNLQLFFNDSQREAYNDCKRTQLFHFQYLEFTGRSYLANYLRRSPMHHMWRGDYFGQEHWVMTRETHFIQMPSASELQEISTHSRILKESDRRMLQQYRDPSKKQMNMTLKCVSVAPRVFEINDFLSPIEVDHLLSLASQLDLHLSKTGDENIDDEETETRTSYNSWIKRETTPITDAIYRRAADLLRIDESFLRQRDTNDVGSDDHDIPADATISEDLQLVHYEPKQQYMDHHDFGVDDLDEEPSYQSTRFATLLLYLNEDMKGGETSFPRWVNGETFRPLKVKPVAGKAVLFYSQLPDGNLDDFSQHASLPVIAGEKWLLNLWVWEPLFTK